MSSVASALGLHSMIASRWLDNVGVERINGNALDRGTIAYLVLCAKLSAANLLVWQDEQLLALLRMVLDGDMEADLRWATVLIRPAPASRHIELTAPDEIAMKHVSNLKAKPRWIGTAQAQHAPVEAVISYVGLSTVYAELDDLLKKLESAPPAKAKAGAVTAATA